MKTILTSVLVATGLLFGGVAIAGPGHDGQCTQGERSKEDRKAAAAARLDLSEEQQVQFDAVMKEMHEERRALRESNLAPEERKAAMQALGDETEAKVAAFLDADQMESFQEMRAEKMAKRSERHQKKEARKAETIERLNLDDAQVAQFEEVMKASHLARRELRAQAKESGERPERSEMKAMRAETDAQLAEFLSAEQMEEWKAIQKENHRERRGGDKH